MERFGKLGWVKQRSDTAWTVSIYWFQSLILILDSDWDSPGSLLQVPEILTVEL